MELEGPGSPWGDLGFSLVLLGRSLGVARDPWSPWRRLWESQGLPGGGPGDFGEVLGDPWGDPQEVPSVFGSLWWCLGSPYGVTGGI